MINIKSKRQAGITIFEAILVIVISGVIILIGLRQYRVFRADADARQVRFNIDMLFQAAANFYKSECYGVGAPSNFTPGKLNPNHAPAPANPFPISVQNDFINQGYLPVNLIALTPIVTDYVVQFNQYTAPRMMCTNASCSTQKQIGIIVIWRPQVAVLLTDPTLSTQYLGILGGDCLSSASNNMVVSCKNAGAYATQCQGLRNTPSISPLFVIANQQADQLGCPATGSTNSYFNYVVWERAPSFAVPGSQPSTWITMPVVNQFTQQYRNGLLQAPNQYFLCGG